MDNTFGRWVRQRRKKLDLTQKELAQRVGCSASAVRKIEADLRRPSKQIAGLLGQQLLIAPEEHEIFVKIARGKLPAEHLEELSWQAEGAGVPVPDRQALGEPANGRNLPQPAPLPTLAAPAVGRAFELRQVLHLLANPECQMITITGPGGAGKTHLAVRAAHQVAALLESPGSGMFSDGVYWFSSIQTPQDVLSQILASVAPSPSRGKGPADERFSQLRDKKALFVLDGIEHLLLERCAPGSLSQVLCDITQQAPQVKLITTSRYRLRLHGEWAVPLLGLPVPAGNARPETASGDAVDLFQQYARQIDPCFEVGPENLPWILRICRSMDGLPLGIELAAGWVGVLSCAEIAQEIEHDPEFPKGSQCNLPARHYNMKVVFDSSWNLLSEEERDQLMRLSVFESSFGRNEAESAAGVLLESLKKLADKSLLYRAGDGRYQLYRFVRLFTSQKLLPAQDSISR